MATNTGKSSESSIEIRFMYRGQRYAEKIKLKPDTQGLRAAKNFRAEIISAIDKGTFEYWVSFPDSKHASKFKPESKTLENYLLNTYLPRFEKYGKARTIKTYRNIIKNQLIPPFGHLDLNEISVPIVKKWIDTLDISAKSIRNLMSPLRSALNEAVEDGLIEINPLASYSPKIRNTAPKEDDIDPITYEEEDTLLAAAPKNFKNLLKFALWTGLRPQEYLALIWQDIDLTKGTVNINKAKSDHVAVETTKTKASIRTLTLLEPALNALIAQKELTFTGNDDHVFKFNGKCYSGVSQLRRFEWDSTFKESGVRRRPPKQTRHTFASRMLNAGEPLLWVSKYLGHADPSMTLRAYARFMPDENQKAGSKALAKSKEKLTK